MDSLLVKIRELRQELTGKDRCIADYILEHEKQSPWLTIKQLADGSGVSQSAVVRFCKLFGSRGYRDFRNRLAQDVLAKAPGQETSAASFTWDLAENEHLPSIAARIASDNMRAVQETVDLLNEEILNRAVDALAKARTIGFFGCGASGIVAMDAYQKFIRIGKACNASQDSHVQMTVASNLRKGDVAVIFSYSGRTRDVLEIAAAASERGATILVVTKYGHDNPLAAMADITVFTTAPEVLYRSSASSSRIAQLTVVDILFSGTASRNLEAYSENLESTYKYATIKKS